MKAPTLNQITDFANDMHDSGIHPNGIAVYMNTQAMENRDVPAAHRIGRNTATFKGFSVLAVYAIAVDDLGNACVLMAGNVRKQFLHGEVVE